MKISALAAVAVILSMLAAVTAAQASATLPRAVRCMFRSVSIRAKTGNAVMLMAAPMKSANPVKVTLSSDNLGYK